MERLEVCIRAKYKESIIYIDQAMINHAIEQKFSESEFNATFNYNDCIEFISNPIIPDDVISVRFNHQGMEYLKYIGGLQYDAYIVFSRENVQISWASKQDALHFLTELKERLAT